MNEGSLFNNLNQTGIQKQNTQEINKELVVETARADIAKIKETQKEIDEFIAKIDSSKADLGNARVEYKKDLEALLSAFENEEHSAVLAENGVTNVKGLQETYSGTDEVKALSGAEKSVSENIKNIRALRQDVAKFLRSEKLTSEDMRTLRSELHWEKNSLDREIFKLSIDTPEGRESWPVSYPTGLYHQETQNETIIKTEESKLKDIYHSLGDSIDRAMEDAVREFNDPEVSFTESHIPGQHMFHRSSIQVEDGKVTFTFGQGYGSFTYELSRGKSGTWAARRVASFKGLYPNEFLSKFNDKLRALDMDIDARISQLK